MSITKNIGATSLNYGYKVSKDDIRVEICGQIDEISAFLGLAKSVISDKKAKLLIEHIQKDLIVLAGEIATLAKDRAKLKNKIKQSNLDFLDNKIKELKPKEKFDSFYLSGQDFSSSLLNVARALVRRLERYLVTLDKIHNLTNNHIFIYINRLSNLLYLLLRS